MPRTGKDRDLPGRTRGLADLHRHLDGSLRPATLAELAQSEGVAVPADLTFHAGMGLEAALERFAVTLSVLQRPEAVRRVAAEIAEDAAAEGVTTLEVRFAPQLHHGAPLEEIVDAAADGLDGRAGLVLCGLYGEDPRLLERLVAAAEARPAVVGLDLAGSPAPGHRWALADYGPVFRRAAQLGLGTTVHAGEGRPADEIVLAVRELGARRIGHGTSLLESAEALERVLAEGVTVEACPTSNVHTGAIAALDEHPLPRWLAAGVSACVNTDNTLLSGVDAPGELERAAKLPGMTAELVERAVANGHAGAFARR